MRPITRHAAAAVPVHVANATNEANEFAWSSLNNGACNDQCGTSCLLDCYEGAWVYNYCSGDEVECYAADCCPCASQAGCAVLPPCDQNSAFNYPLLDCTGGFFAALGGNMDEGRIPIAVYCP